MHVTILSLSLGGASLHKCCGINLYGQNLYGQKKKAAKKAVDKARNDMEADLYTKLDEDAAKNIIYKMARHRNE